MHTQGQDLMNSIGLLILRLGMGGYMASHGWGKLQMVLARNFDQFGDPIGLGSGLSLVLVVTGAALTLTWIGALIGIPMFLVAIGLFENPKTLRGTPCAP